MALGVQGSALGAGVHPWEGPETVGGPLRRGQPSKILPRVLRQLVRDVTKAPRPTRTDLRPSPHSLRVPEWEVKHSKTYGN